MTTCNKSFLFSLCLASGLVANCLARPSQGQEITKDEAISMIEQYPRDPYWQYVVVQVFDREGRPELAKQYLPRELTARRRANARNQSVDLFSIFSGSLAIQESLQLDALTGELENDDSAEMMDVSALEGPTVKSHPWGEMLGSKESRVSELAGYVPEDQLFVRFDSVAKLMQSRSLGKDFSTYVVTQTKQSSRSANLVQMIQQQLALETNDLLVPAYDAVVEEIAITSSDVFFRDGTDVTLLMKLTQPEIIRGQLEGFLDRAAELPNATSETGEIDGVSFRHVSTPERKVHVYSAFPKPDLLVRSNSRPALERILKTIAGGEDAPRSLSHSIEFRYIRTLMELGDDREDGFVYMSDPFIRRLIGPQTKLTQRRRLICKSHLQLISHACLLYQTEQGRLAASLKDLVEAKCLPRGSFTGTEDPSQAKLTCPDGGHYALSPDGHVGVCTHHGTAAHLTPCIEIPIDEVTAGEAKAYNEFVTAYSRYWQTFFDPIAVRLQHTPKRYRIETIVLPLINNTIYQNLSSVLGGEPANLDALPIPERNIFTLNFNFAKERLLKQFEIAPTSTLSVKEPYDFSLPTIGLALFNYHDAYKRFPPLPLNDEPSQLSWRVHLLPFLGEGELYQQFRLNEPWDSAHNQKLIGKMPAAFKGPSQELNIAGQTQIVFPSGEGTLHHSRLRGPRIAEITDGTSNTVMAVIADPTHAVVWTEPADLAVDWDNLRSGWSESIENGTPILMADLSEVVVPEDIDNASLASTFTRAGGEPRAEFLNRNQRRLRSRRQLPFFEELRLAELLTSGVGSQVGFHVCDADPLIDFNMPRFLGMMAGNFRGGNGFDLFDEEGAIALMVASLNAPIYLSVPVEDAAVVDETLQLLDKLLAKTAREPFDDDFFFRIDQDFYRSQQHGELNVRSYAFQFGPLTWRFHWARIGNGLYIASKPFIIDELASATADQAATGVEPEDIPRGHGMVRVRPQHWERTLPHFRIGWAESERVACFGNLGVLSAASRGIDSSEEAPKDSPQVSQELEQLTKRVFATTCECPSHGRYVLKDQSVVCTKHGHPAAPQQPAGSMPGRISELAESLKDVRLELTFLDDGLHATVVIDK